MELLTLGLFACGLLLCLLAGQSVLYALLFGLILFSVHALRKGFSAREVVKMWGKGVLTAKNVVITMLLIGILTALWRACGTIPEIITLSSALFIPSIFLPVTFLLCCTVSFLTGTSFGTVATMGVICWAMGSSMGVSPMWLGGAILSGIFFGDRCSPVSTSALLVSEQTDTDLYRNLRNMVRSAFVPFLLTLGIYIAVGLLQPRGGIDGSMLACFAEEFRLTPILLIPAAAILLLSLFRVPVKRTMLIGIVLTIPFAVFGQGMAWRELFRTMVFGYTAHSAALKNMISGGGATSMLKVVAIICLSSAYSGIFQKTGLLEPVRGSIAALAKRSVPSAAVLLTSVITCMISCNQTLGIMLTRQLCDGLRTDPEVAAIDLEDSAVLVAPLVPWSIAGVVPISLLGAPQTCLLAACYLYFVPMWRVVREWFLKYKR